MTRQDELMGGTCLQPEVSPRPEWAAEGDIQPVLRSLSNIVCVFVVHGIYIIYTCCVFTETARVTRGKGRLLCFAGLHPGSQVEGVAGGERDEVIITLGIQWGCFCWTGVLRWIESVRRSTRVSPTVDESQSDGR